MESGSDLEVLSDEILRHLTPIVSYRCVTRGCGRNIAAVFAIDRRPVLAMRIYNSDFRNPEGVDRLWIAGIYIDKLRSQQETPFGETEGMLFSCARHGYQLIAVPQILESFQTALNSRPLEVKVDQLHKGGHRRESLGGGRTHS